MNIMYLRYALMALLFSCCFVVEGQASEDSMEIVGPEIVHTNPASRKRSLESNQDHETIEEPSTKRQKANSLSSQEESDDAVGDCNSNIPDAMDVEGEPRPADIEMQVKKKVARNVPEHWEQLKEILGEDTVVRRADLIAKKIPREIKSVQNKVKWCCKNLSKLKLEYRCIEFLAKIVKWEDHHYMYRILKDLHDRELINNSQYSIFISKKSKGHFKDRLESAIQRNLTREALSSKFGETASVLYPNLNFDDNTFVRHIRNFFGQGFINHYCQYLFNPLPHKGKEDIPVIDMVREFMNDPSNHLKGGYRIIARRRDSKRDPDDGSLHEAFLRKNQHRITDEDIASTTLKTSYARLKRRGLLTDAAIRFYESCKSSGRPMSIEKWQKQKRRLNRNG